MNLLSNPWLPVETVQGRRLWTLPQLFAAWGNGSVSDIMGLQAHQRPVVETFFATLAAHALEVAGESSLAHDSERWGQLLGQLASTAHAPHFFDLVVDDPTSAAFMQPALTPSLSVDRQTFDPLDFDTRVLSKNHDCKTVSPQEPSVAEWVYMLITVQTSVGYTGKTLYGISRMNGGYGTRVFCASYADNSAAGRWREDVPRLLAWWASQYTGSVLGYREDGHRLLAAVAWDGVSQLQLNELHPGYVEIARAFRMGFDGSRLTLRYKGTGDYRVAVPELLEGCLEDPWTPLRQTPRSKKAKAAAAPAAAGLKAESPSAEGFTPKQVLSVLFDSTIVPNAFYAPSDRSKPAVFTLRALSRGQGQTNGYQDYAIPVPAKVSASLFAAKNSAPRIAIETLYQEALKVTQKLLFMAELAYLYAHLPTEADRETADGLRKRPSAKQQLSQLTTAFEGFWAEQLFPWAAQVIETKQPMAEALEQWLTLQRSFLVEQLLQLLRTGDGSRQAGPLLQAKALRRLPSSLSKLFS